MNTNASYRAGNPRDSRRVIIPPKGRIVKLDHINIRAPRELLEQERQFFCDLLGLREGERPAFGSHGYWLYSGEAAVVHLSEGGARAGDDGQGHFDHAAFRSSGLRELVERLDRNSTDYRIARVPGLDLTQVFVVSPANVRIEINFAGETI